MKVSIRTIYATASDDTLWILLELNSKQCWQIQYISAVLRFWAQEGHTSAQGIYFKTCFL